MKIVLDGKCLDTSKAIHHWDMSHFDGRNQHCGDLYLSSRGTWYISTPSQWTTGHRWEMVDPREVVETYRRYFDEAETAQILALAGIEAE